MCIRDRFINFGAFVGFTMVNVSVIAYYFQHRSEQPNRFLYVVLPAIGATVDLYLLFNLDILAKLVGGSWLLLGLIYLAFLTRGFTQKSPELGAHTSIVWPATSEPNKLEHSTQFTSDHPAPANEVN